jgi:predicted Holliday junction resolvase-like endonuclease
MTFLLILLSISLFILGAVVIALTRRSENLRQAIGLTLQNLNTTVNTVVGHTECLNLHNKFNDQTNEHLTQIYNRLEDIERVAVKRLPGEVQH